MKFCKNLQRVADISDPEWAPYWTNYKMLKKLIKELPSLVPSDEHGNKQRVGNESEELRRSETSSSNESSDVRSDTASLPARQQHHGDITTEVTAEVKPQGRPATSIEAASVAVAPKSPSSIDKSPGEVAFFKLLHAEYHKATQFFERAQQEFVIREERVRKGMEIMKQPNSIMVNEKWALLAKSLYRLYKDLLLLETFAIMTYCSFSKILKKHDKVTGYSTRNAFMENVVNKANFTSYPVVMEMIKSCETMYEEVSTNLIKDGKEGLYEDERLFINMIHRLNEQCMDTADQEGVPERNDIRRPLSEIEKPKSSLFSSPSAAQLSSLQEIVADMGVQKTAGQVSDGGDCVSSRKRRAEDECALDKKQRSK